jgi:hypothetical protein
MWIAVSPFMSLQSIISTEFGFLNVPARPLRLECEDEPLDGGTDPKVPPFGVLLRVVIFPVLSPA